MSVESAMSTAQLPVREHWHTLLELATSEVFEIMLDTRLEACHNPDSAISSEFTAMVGFAGSLCGVMSLRCTAASASLMASKMLGVAPGEADQESWDAIGEVCNMIAGNFKAKLAGAGPQCMLSVPTIITGADYQLHSLADGGTVEVPMRFDSEIIWIVLEVHS